MKSAHRSNRIHIFCMRRGHLKNKMNLKKEQNDLPVMAIIGGGFCGMAVCVQLIRQATTPLIIKWIQDGKQPGRGIAYSSYNPNHLLNVAAGRMSLFPDEPDHFCHWLLSRKEYQEFQNQDLPSLFIPRVIYGHYLEDTLHQHLQKKESHVQVECIFDEAVDIDFHQDHAVITLKQGEPVEAGSVILATGNEPPADPIIQNRAFYDHQTGYFRNPWTSDSVVNVEKLEHVLIIGTGLTMVDTVCSLMENGFAGKITAVSTRGFEPLSHKKTVPYTSILDEVKPGMPLKEIYHVFKKHIRAVLASGITGEVVVDAIRPLTQQIWFNLPLQEKKSFMHHLRHLWGVARHRLPSDIHGKIIAWKNEGRLRIISGRLFDLEQQHGSGIVAIIRQRKSGNMLTLKTDRVINCTGPQTDIRKMNRPLIRNLLKKGMIAPDEMALGMDALINGTLLDAGKKPSPYLSTLGGNLKGILWESTAVPELRIQARDLAALRLAEINQQKRFPVFR